MADPRATGVTVDPSGKIAVQFRKPGEPEELRAPLDTWLEKHAHKAQGS